MNEQDNKQKSCPHFGVCGGCSFQNVPYKEQIAKKESDIREILKPFDITNIKPIIASPNIYYYRNKMEYAFGRTRDKEFALGLRERKSFSRFVDIRKCLLLSEISDRLLEQARGWAVKNDISVYNPITHRGMLRYFVIREGKRTGDILITFITTPDINETLVRTFAAGLKSSFPQITTFIWGKNSGLSDVAKVETSEVLWGNGYIEDKIGKLTFKISPSTFFQTNTIATEKLYDTIKDAVVSCGSRDKTVLDLYCGNGGIALYVAPVSKEVLGVEINPDAVRDAQSNAINNSVENVKFVCSEMEKWLPLMPPDYSTASIAIIDPPRSGLHPKTLKKLTEFKFPYLIYVSCNPPKFAADMQALLPIYEVLSVQPLDLFPHTPHVEAVAVLKKRFM